MKTILPMAAASTPGASPDSRPSYESVSEDGSFASVLDRCAPAQPEANEVADVVEEQSPEMAGGAKEDAVEETLPTPTLALPMLPYQPEVQPRGVWSPMEQATPSGESNQEFAPEPTAATAASYHWPPASAPISPAGGYARPNPPAQTAAPFFAAPSRAVNILAATDQPQTVAATEPVSTAPALGQIVGEARPVVATAQVAIAHAPPQRTQPWRHALASTGDEPVAGESMQPGHEVGAGIGNASGIPQPTAPVDAVLADVGGPPAVHQRAQPAREMLADPGQTSPTANGVASTPEPSRLQGVTKVRAEIATPEAPAPLAPATDISPLRSTPAPRDGIPAAKRGEVMPSTALQAPPKPRVATSAEALVEAVEHPEIAAFSGIADEVKGAEFRPIATAAQMVATTPRAPEPRRTAVPQTLPLAAAPARVPMEAELRSEVRPIRAHGVVAATPVEAALVHEEEEAATIEPTAGIEPGAAPHFSAIKPQSDPAMPAPVRDGAPIHHAELVRIAERTLDAAVRLRATGPERIELSVQLASGDRLTIQLQLANGEVTPHFHTSSDSLRTALEQNWSQFSERAGDRGVRLTAPVFDVNSSSSHMTDLSQQRHGRETTDPQAELFPHLPRRARAPRVLTAAPSTPAPALTSGVRAYA